MSKVLLIFLLLITTSVVGLADEDVLRPEGRSDGYSSSSSSKKFAVGLEGGLTYNMFSADLNWTDANGNPTTANSFLNAYEDMSGISGHFGFFVDYSINNLFGIQLKFLNNWTNATGSSLGIRDFYDGFGFYLGTEVVDYDITLSSTYFNVEPSLRINANENLYFLIGPSFNFGYGQQEQTLKQVKEETTIVFLEPSDGRGFERESTQSTDFSESRTALNFAVGYKFEVGDNIFIAPQITYSYDITDHGTLTAQNLEQERTEGLKNLSLDNQSLNQLRFSLAVWFDKAF